MAQSVGASIVKFGVVVKRALLKMLNVCDTRKKNYAHFEWRAGQVKNALEKMAGDADTETTETFRKKNLESQIIHFQEREKELFFA